LGTLCHSEGRPFLALTVAWKLSYATLDGFLLICGEKCGLAWRGRLRPAETCGTYESTIRIVIVMERRSDRTW